MIQRYSDKLEQAKAHDRKLIEASFHSGIAPKSEVLKFFKEYGCMK